MTLIGDSDYLNGDKSKLKKNKYGKSDPNFSGMLLYFTPEGKYINHWQYKNGKIVPDVLSAVKTEQNAGNYKSQSKGTFLASIDFCTDFYTYIVRADGSESAHEYSYTTCKTYYYDDSSGGAGGDGGSTGSSTGSGGSTGGSASTSPAPTRTDCPTILNVSVNRDQHKSMRYATPGDSENPGDGGFPSPTPDCPTSTPVENRDTTINIKDPCIRSQVKASLAVGLDSFVSEFVNAIFTTSKDINMSFRDTVLAPSVDGITLSQGNFDNNGYFDANITINSRLASGSREYIAATIIHEVVHSYLTFNGVLGELNQYTEQATRYAYALQHDLLAMFPGMDPDDAIALSWGGLQQTQGWQDILQKDPKKANDILLINGEYKNANGTKGHRCN